MTVATHQVGDGVLIQIPVSIGFKPETASLLAQAPERVEADELLLSGARILELDSQSYYSFGGLVGKIRSKQPSVHVLMRGSFAKPSKAL